MFSYEEFCKVNDSHVIHIERLDLSKSLVYATVGGVPRNFSITMLIQRIMQGRDYYISNPSLLKPFFEDTISNNINRSNYNFDFPKFISHVIDHCNKYLAMRDLELTSAKIESINSAVLTIYQEHKDYCGELHGKLDVRLNISYKQLVKNGVKLHLQGTNSYTDLQAHSYPQASCSHSEDINKDVILNQDTLHDVLSTICCFLL